MNFREKNATPREGGLSGRWLPSGREASKHFCCTFHRMALLFQDAFQQSYYRFVSFPVLFLIKAFSPIIKWMLIVKNGEDTAAHSLETPLTALYTLSCSFCSLPRPVGHVMDVQSRLLLFQGVLLHTFFLKSLRTLCTEYCRWPQFSMTQITIIFVLIPLLLDF